MRAFGLPSILAALVLASPAISSVLLPRKQVCANDGHTVAGTVFTRDLLETSSSVYVRSGSPIPCIWCHISSATYIVVRALTDPGLLRDGMLPFYQRYGVTTAAALLQNVIRADGDTVLAHGSYTYEDEWVRVRVDNTNNHQLTRGVTLAAFLALKSWMIAYGVYGTAAFDVYDGENLVGKGTLELLSGL